MTRPISLTPNVTLRKSVEEWADKNASWMLVSTIRFLIALDFFQLVPLIQCKLAHQASTAVCLFAGNLLLIRQRHSQTKAQQCYFVPVSLA